MISEQAILRALEQKQKSVAEEALKAPRDGSTYEYGRAVGMYAGLDMAREVIVQALQDEKVKTFL
jgi:hypothetical protein